MRAHRTSAPQALPQTRNDLQLWVREHLELPSQLETALLEAVDAVFTRHERLWQESKQEAIQAVAHGRSHLSRSLAWHLIEIAVEGEQVDGVDQPRSITIREREVVQLIAEGLSSKQIGGALNISTRTVESHRAKLMEKLRIRNVTGLVRYAIREGLVSL